MVHWLLLPRTCFTGSIQKCPDSPLLEGAKQTWNKGGQKLPWNCLFLISMKTKGLWDWVFLLLSTLWICIWGTDVFLAVCCCPVPQLIACGDVLGLVQPVCELWAALNQVHLSCPNFFCVKSSEAFNCSLIKIPALKGSLQSACADELN